MNDLELMDGILRALELNADRIEPGAQVETYDRRVSGTDSSVKVRVNDRRFLVTVAPSV